MATRFPVRTVACKWCGDEFETDNPLKKKCFNCTGSRGFSKKVVYRISRASRR